MRCAWVLVAGGILCLSLPALPVLAEDECPAAVKTAVEKTFPGSSVKKCKSEMEHGKQMYDVKLKTKDGDVTRMEHDPSGLVLVTRQYITAETVPTVVMKTYKAKHQDYKLVKTEKWVYPDGKATYRLTYLGEGGAKKTVVYSTEGTLVEEVATTEVEDMD